LMGSMETWTDWKPKEPATLEPGTRE
jgi:hypothetical protein